MIILLTVLFTLIVATILVALFNACVSRFMSPIGRAKRISESTPPGAIHSIIVKLDKFNQSGDDVDRETCKVVQDIIRKNDATHTREYSEALLGLSEELFDFQDILNHLRSSGRYGQLYDMYQKQRNEAAEYTWRQIERLIVTSRTADSGQVTFHALTSLTSSAEQLRKANQAARDELQAYILNPKDEVLMSFRAQQGLSILTETLREMRGGSMARDPAINQSRPQIKIELDENPVRA